MGVYYAPVGKPEDVQAGSLLQADLGGRPVLLTRVGDEIVAFSRRCPHEDTDLAESGEVADGRIRCDAHNYWFDLKSGACVLPASGPPLAVLPVELRDGQVCIRLEW